MWLGAAIMFRFAPLPLIIEVDAAALNEFRHFQSFEVPADGLARLKIPSEVLDVSTSGLNDIRLVDASGIELPYAVFVPRLPTRADERLTNREHGLRIAVENRRTVITFRGNWDVDLEGLTLESPSASFFKSLNLFSETGDAIRHPLLTGYPVFREARGASQMYLPFKGSGRASFSISIDDTRSKPIPITGIIARTAVRESVLAEEVDLDVIKREELPGETRLLLDFRARHQHLARLEIQAMDRVFTRTARLLSRRVEDGELREIAIGSGTVFRTVDSSANSRLDMNVERVLPQRELWLAIQNDNSTPLNIESVRGFIRPFHLLFAASQGECRLFTGNRRAASPAYDLARMNLTLESTKIADSIEGSLESNPDYQPTDLLGEVPLLGAELDLEDWSFRKALPALEAGVYRLRLDLEILARSRNDLGDVRMINGNRQLPYLLERSARVDRLSLDARIEPDLENPSYSRWRLDLPIDGLPVNELTCSAETPLFKRSMSLYEIITNRRGEKLKRLLGSGNWVVTPQSRTNRLSLVLSETPKTAALYLETDNGDNPAVQMTEFSVAVPVTRVLFKSGAGMPCEIYYGNPNAFHPKYDLSLVAADLLEADPVEVQPGSEVRLGNKPWFADESMTGVGGILLWGVLGLVVIGLLAVIARMLPKTDGAKESSR